jgi:hypothetical protein
MREFKFLKGLFIKRHETIDNQEYLDKYINFIINYKITESFEYVERHHILPRSTFPEFEKENWNIIELDYDSHRLVHLWLFKSINIRAYQKPLNWMMNYYKNSEEVSNAAKRGWIKLKSDEEKYNNWRKKKSDSMKDFRNSEKYKEYMIEYFNNPNYCKFKKIKVKKFGDRYSSENQRRRANIFWKNISEDEYINFCNKIKSYWTEDKINEKSKQMNEYYSNIENVEKKRKETQDRWNSMDEESRLKFKEKMGKINKEESKRIDAGNKIKKKWEDTEYLEKMKNRKHRPGSMIKIIKPNGEEIIMETMRKFEREYSFSTHLIRKYRDTDNRISENDLNENNLILLNSIIKSVKTNG